jgi:hypothetical protein
LLFSSDAQGRSSLIGGKRFFRLSSGRIPDLKIVDDFDFISREFKFGAFPGIRVRRFGFLKRGGTSGEKKTCRQKNSDPCPAMTLHETPNKGYCFRNNACS